MFMKKLLAVAAIGCCVGGNSLTDPQASASPQEFWESMLTAKGGRVRLQSVQALVFQSSTRYPAWSRSDVVPGTQYEFVAQFPDRCWVWGDFRPGSMGFSIAAWELSSGTHWLARNGMPARRFAVTPDLARSLRRRLEELQVLYLLETKFLRPTIVSLVRHQDSPTAVLTVQTPEYSKVEYTVEVATRLPLAVRLTPRLPDGDGVPKHLFFEGDQDVSGVRMPRRVEGMGDVTFIVNPRIDPRLFTTAPDGVASRDAWRKWLLPK